jgi:hypothetical protein
LAFSADKGETWSQPISLDEEVRRWPSPPTVSPLQPTIAVNRDGVVGVTWYARRGTGDSLGWTVRFRASFDGGQTFVPSVEIPDAGVAFDGEARLSTKAVATGGGGPWSRPDGNIRLRLAYGTHGFLGGDYQGMAADADGVFHVYWIDNRTGWNQVWTAAVQAGGKAVRNGDRRLSDLEDVTALVGFEIRHVEYDPKTRRATARVCVINTSDRAIHAPLMLRLVSLDSYLGEPEVVNAVNRDNGPGAVWDLSALLSDGQLPPGQSTPETALIFLHRQSSPILPRGVRIVQA